MMNEVKSKCQIKMVSIVVAYFMEIPSGSRNYGALHNEHYILCIVMSITTPSLISAFASNTRQDLRPLVAIAIADKLTENVIRQKP